MMLDQKQSLLQQNFTVKFQSKSLYSWWWKTRNRDTLHLFQNCGWSFLWDSLDLICQPLRNLRAVRPRRLRKKREIARWHHGLGLGPTSAPWGEQQADWCYPKWFCCLKSGHWNQNYSKLPLYVFHGSYDRIDIHTYIYNYIYIIIHIYIYIINAIYIHTYMLYL